MGKNRSLLGVAILCGGLVAACSGDINDDSSAVLLTAVAAPRASQIDIAVPINGQAAPGGYVDVSLRVQPKRIDATDTRFLAVQMKTYRVSYVRADGGRTVPNGFVSVLPLTIEANQTATVTNLQIFNPNTFTQAPFAALLSQNGGVDPETGQRFVKLLVNLEFFGETLSGEDVYASTTVPYTFCNGCGFVTP